MSPEKPAGLTSPVKKEEFYPTGLTEDPFFSLCPEDEEDWASSFLNAAGVANPSLTSASKKKTSNIDAKHTKTSKIHNVAGMGKYCYQPTEIHEITVPVSQDTKPDGFLTVAMDQEWTLASPKPRYVAHGNNLELLSNQQLLPTESQPLKLPTQAEKFEQSQELEKLNDFACWVTDDQDTRDLPNLQIANQIDATGVSSPSHSPKKTSDTVTVEPPRKKRYPSRKDKTNQALATTPQAVSGSLPTCPGPGRALSSEEKYRRMRDLNNVASRRCRQTRKRKRAAAESELHELQLRNQQLQRDVAKLQQDVLTLRSRIKDGFK